MGYSFRLGAMILLYAPSHRQYNTYHGLCYTSRGALAGTRNSSMVPPWRIDPTTNRTMSERSYHGATSRPLESDAGNTHTHTHTHIYIYIYIYIYTHARTRNVIWNIDFYILEFDIILVKSHTSKESPTTKIWSIVRIFIKRKNVCMCVHTQYISHKISVAVSWSKTRILYTLQLTDRITRRILLHQLWSARWDEI